MPPEGLVDYSEEDGLPDEQRQADEAETPSDEGDDE